MNTQTVKGLLMTDQSEGVAASLQAILDALDGFADTPTASHISMALERAYSTSAITVIAGVPGVGKTTTCKRFVETNSYVWRCQFTRYTRTPYTVLSQIATAIDINTVYRPGELGQRIEATLGQRGGMLICDEAQHLTADGFEIVRGLFDTVNDEGACLGIALVGHADLMQKIASLPQLLGRVSAPLNIAAITPRDVDALLDKCGITDGKTRTFLRNHAGQSTGFRRIVNALKDAVTYAGSDGVALNVDHVRQAWTDLAGSIVK